MKKLSIAAAVAVAFAVAAPVSAAPSLAITGNLQTTFTARPSSVTNESFLNLQAGLSSGDQKTKAVVIMAPWSKPDSLYTQKIDPATGKLTEEFIPSNAASFAPAGQIADPSNPSNIVNVPGAQVGEAFNGTLFGTPNQGFQNFIKSMYLQTTGAYWNGGPEATTTIGSMAVNESPFVGDLGNRRGIKVEGLKLGPLGVEAFYATSGGFSRVLNANSNYKNPQTRIKNVDSVEGVNLNAKIAGINLGANVVKSDENSPEMAFTAAASPIAGFTMDGFLVQDRNENKAMKVNGALQVAKGLTLNASYRKADEAVAPLYGTRYDADGNGVVTTDEWVNSVNNNLYQAFDNRTGATVGADAKIGGLHMNGSYDMATTSIDPSHTLNVGADTQLVGFKLAGAAKYVDQTFAKSTWSAVRDFNIGGLKITGMYDGEFDHAALNGHAADTYSNEVKAQTALDFIQPLKGITLDGRVKTYSDGSQNDYEANANYTAPNGMILGAHYLRDANHPDGDKSVTAGMNVNF